MPDRRFQSPFLNAQVLSKLDYLIDLHTASFGRVNSYYVRADMNAPVTRLMSMLAHPQIIVHNTGLCEWP